MSGIHKKRATVRPAMPWLSLCAALVAVGVLLLPWEASRADGSHGLRTQGRYAPVLRQALFGRHNSSLDSAGTGLAAGALSAPSAERVAGGGFDSTADPVSASEAAVSVPSGSLVGTGAEEVPATSPLSAH